MNDAQHGFREKARPFISTIVAHDVGPEDEICGLSSDRVVKAGYSSDRREVATPLFSTSGASQRGAEVRMNSTNNEQRKHRDAAEPLFSTFGARNVGLEEDGQVPHRVATPLFSTVSIRSSQSSLFKCCQAQST